MMTGRQATAVFYRFAAALTRARLIRACAAAVLLAPALVAQGQEEPVINLRSTVIGNQEQPKVMYIVPWQAPDGPDSLYQPMESLVSDVFRPIDREEFRRELRYRNMLETIHEKSTARP